MNLAIIIATGEKMPSETTLIKAGMRVDCEVAMLIAGRLNDVFKLEKVKAVYGELKADAVPTADRENPPFFDVVVKEDPALLQEEQKIANLKAVVGV